MSLRKELEAAMVAVKEAAHNEAAAINRITDLYNEKQEADLAYVAMMSGVDIEEDEDDAQQDV